MITPRTVCKQGFLDVDREDYNDPKDQYFAEKQVSQLNVIQDKWLDNHKVLIHIQSMQDVRLLTPNRGKVLIHRSCKRGFRFRCAGTSICQVFVSNNQDKWAVSGFPPHLDPQILR